MGVRSHSRRSGSELQIAELREQLRAEGAGVVADRFVHLALNEAEGLVAETDYPELLFPELAAEKIRALRSWAAMQNAIRRSSPVLVLAE